MPREPKTLNAETLALVAERFRLLGDPVRLSLLQSLGAGERSVTTLLEEAGTTQANVSKHLQLLLRAGLVSRRRDGLHVYYAIADPSVFDLCDAVCGSLTEQRARELTALRRTGRSEREGS